MSSLSLAKRKTPAFWSDRPFWLAVAAGPVCWVVLQQLGLPVVNNEIAWKLLLMAVVVYPVLEEFVFRGGLQDALYQHGRLSRSAAGVSLANVITSVAFAAMHLFSQSAIWAALIFFPSLIFGYMRDRYGKIHASIVLHIFYNAGFIVLFAG